MHIELEKDKNLADIVSKLKAHFKPEKIFLFGSRAKGTATAESDYDLFLIVKNSSKTKMERMDEANLVLWGRTSPVDVFVYTQKEFDESKSLFQSIPYIVNTEGVEL
ncbi:MAG TPA: nucleotidyltransferase domain-containing protein [Pseudobdellovibrionaceae bacterium]|jgi:predicted nucleotidyltransferase